ncbi:hypothetical protein D7I44_01665 [Gryllotalpicola protaetiae]|uniref:Uncharacterized protein n=1 Tax=Gryllotalpicola protaetiae TaxID=2419771 RepID=A0A387BEH5_9MICO|nr:hypothetical protein D7I44_01665 [Gryllotalpicola protaetiae]
MRITFYAADLDPATAQITLYRTVDGVRTTVRSGLRALALGGWTGVDWEAPLGPVTYQAAMVDAAGNALGDTAPLVAVIPSPRPDTAWISDPLDAGSAVKVTMVRGAGLAQSRPVQGSRLLLGTRVIALAGQRSLMTGLAMPFFTDTDAAREAVTRLITQTGGLVLIRTAAPHPLPRLLYAWASDPQPSSYRDPAGGYGITSWASTVDEISEVEGPPAIAAAPWQAYRDAFPTWEFMRAIYPVWLEAKKNPPQAGVVPTE